MEYFLFICFLYWYILQFHFKSLKHNGHNSVFGARGSAVGWGTAIQVGRSRVRFPMVSLDFFIDIILPAALWPWGWLRLYQKWVPGIFPGGKAAGAYGWQPYHLHVPIGLKSGSLTFLEPLGPVQACNGIALPLPLHSVFTHSVFRMILTTATTTTIAACFSLQE